MLLPYSSNTITENIEGVVALRANSFSYSVSASGNLIRKEKFSMVKFTQREIFMLHDLMNPPIERNQVINPSEDLKIAWEMEDQHRAFALKRYKAYLAKKYGMDSAETDYYIPDIELTSSVRIAK